MQLNSSSKTVFRYLAFIVCGLVGAWILVGLSEVLGLSHFNFWPLGGASWALWVYPFYLLGSLLLFYKIFKLPKNILWLILLVTIFFSAYYYYLIGPIIFQNPIPFGIGAIDY